MDPIIIVCDDKGNPTGEYIPKEAGHTGLGKHHLAITVLIYNKSGEVLLQKRKHKRFDGLWDLTGATDLYHFENGKSESFEEATLRCLEREYGVSKVNNLKNLGGFNYFAKWDDLCENEYCAMIVAEYDGEIKLNKKVAYEAKWVDKKELLKDMEENRQKYSPWAKEGLKVLKNTGFFN